MLRIGAFARRASVSIKTLRYYDHVGVFRPAYIDPRSGYRYYETHQLALLRELRTLRELGCSVADLRCWIAGGRADLLLRLRKRICNQLDQNLQHLAAIDDWIHGIPTERNIPDIPAYTLRDRVGATDTAVYRMFEAGERAVARQDARAALQPFLLLHGDDYLDKNADVEICIPVQSAALTAVGGRIVEGVQRAACLGFSGSYSQAPAVLQVIERWMRLRGARTAGPLRESYMRFGADQKGYRLPGEFIASAVEDYRTELQVPVVQCFG